MHVNSSIVWINCANKMDYTRRREYLYNMETKLLLNLSRSSKYPISRREVNNYKEDLFSDEEADWRQTILRASGVSQIQGELAVFPLVLTASTLFMASLNEHTGMVIKLGVLMPASAILVSPPV